MTYLIFIYVLFQFYFRTLNAQGIVQVIPQSRLVASLHGNAVFTCVCGGTGYVVTHVKWFANEEVLVENRNVEIQFHPDPQIGQLRYTNLSMEYNMTRIYCSTVFEDGNNMTSDGSLLLIQGYLSAVGNVTATANDHLTYLTWTAPPSLDVISGYCVDIKSNSSMIFSECGITETEFNFILPSYSACNNYTFTVTPVNALGNGTRFTGSYSGSKPNLSGLIGTGNAYILTMSAPVCHGELAFVDIDTGELSTLGDADVTIAGNTITFSTGQLTGNRHYNGTVTATNAAGLTTSSVTISTHEVMNAAIRSNNIIEVTTIYSEHSDARGALFNFVFIDDNGDVDFTRSVLLALDRNTSLHHTLPFNLYPGQYRVFVYDIESDGTLSNGVGYPAVTIALDSQDFSSQSEFTDTETCDVTTSPGVISAKCTSPSGFQMVTQSSDSNKVHILYINKSTDLQTPVTVEVENGIYQVTIFAIRNNVGILDSHVLHVEEVNVGTTPNTLGIVVGIVVVIVVVIVVGFLVGILVGIVMLRRFRMLKKFDMSIEMCVETTAMASGGPNPQGIEKGRKLKRHNIEKRTSSQLAKEVHITAS